MFSHQAMQREGGHFVNDDFDHMPDFDGLEELKDIEQGFELDDIMSGNDGDFMLPCLEGGDRFYTTNAIQENHVNASQYLESGNDGDFMLPCLEGGDNFNTTNATQANHVNVSQYPQSSTTGSSSSSIGFEGIGSIAAPSHMTPSVDQTTTFNNNSHNGGENNIHNVMSMLRTAEAPTPKIKWSGPLHTRFLKAVNIIGLEKITPKKVLKLMNVPGLTRRNVASHLQKYRLFLKRYADKNFPELRDREKALNAAFFTTMPLLNSKQGATDISIPCPLSFFRTLVGWRTRASFANFSDGISALPEPLYIHPSVPSAASNRGSINQSAPVTHSNGAVLPATRFMQNHHQNVSWSPRNHSTPFNPNPSNNGMISFDKPPQVINGNAAGFGLGQGKLGGQGIYKPNGFEISCFGTSRGDTIRSDIAIPSTDQLGQATFSRNIITQKEPIFGNGSLTPFFAVNGPPDFGKFGTNNPSCQVNNKMSFPQQGLEDASAINAATPVPPAVQSASQPSNDILDDDQIWNDEFVASLLEDIRPLLDELD